LSNIKGSGYGVNPQGSPENASKQGMLLQKNYPNPNNPYGGLRFHSSVNGGSGR